MKRPTSDQISKRAHQLWIERGCQHGSHVQDWLDAEQELTEELSGTDKSMPPVHEPIFPPEQHSIHTATPPAKI